MTSKGNCRRSESAAIVSWYRAAMKSVAPRILVLVMTLGGAQACGSSGALQSKAAAPPAEPSDAAAPLAPRVDEATGPLLTQAAGVAKAEYLPNGTVQIVARADVGGFSYLRVRIAPEYVAQAGHDFAPFRLTCDPNPGCIGVWAVPSGNAAQRSQDAILRWPHQGDVSRPTSIWARTSGFQASSKRELRGGSEMRFAIEDPGIDQKAGDFGGEFRQGLSHLLEHLAPYEPFVAFATSRIRSRSAANPPKSRPSRGSTHDELRSLMDFYTGRGEIERTLQTHRGLGLPRPGFRPSVALAKVRGVEAPKRDYDALVGADPSLAQRPQLGPLAKLLPREAIAIEFPSIQDLVKLPRILDERFDEITRALERQPGSYRLVERYREQLIIEPSKLSEQLGHIAVGAVAMVIGDPYLREGTDVSLVLELRQRNLVEGVLARYVENARIKHPNLELKKLSLEGTDVTVRSTPDGQIRQYSAWVENHLFLSNSPKRLAQLLRIARAAEPALADAADYRWARRVCPFDARKERAHLFFGDDFVASVTGPRSKVLEARRTLAQSELRAVDYAALLHAMVEGAPAKDTVELLKAGWLTRKDLKHFDSSPITWSSASGASSAWGRSSEMTPVVELPLDKLDPAEVSRYDSFRISYESMLRGALDPTSLRVLRTDSDSALRTELRILPLSPAGDLGGRLRDVVRHVGRGSVDAGPAVNGLGAVLAISKDSPLRDLAQSVLSGSVRRKELALGFLGDWVKVGLAEEPLLFDFALSEHEIPEVARPGVQVASTNAASPGAASDPLAQRQPERESIDLEANLHRVPVWAAVQIRSGVLLTAALAALRIELKDNLGDWVTWSEAGKYREHPVSKVEIKQHQDAERPVTIYYAVVKDVLLVSLQRRVLELRIDDVLAGNRPKATPIDSRSTQVAADWSKKAGSIYSALLSGTIERSALKAHEQACAGMLLLAMGLGESAANSGDGAAALRYLGYEPLSPNGPGLKIVGGQCVHPVYGTELEPVLPAARDATVPLHRAIEQLRRLRFGLGIVPRADEMELFGTTEIVFE